MPESTKELSGRELHRAIAEKVMGLRVTHSLAFGGDWTGENLAQGYTRVAAYSESIEAAMQVVEKMRERHCCIYILNQFSQGPQWLVSFDVLDGRNVREVSAFSDSLPEAICRAAFAAIGSKAE